MKRLRRFARRALRRVRRGRSPSEYVATVDGLTVRFSIEGRYSRRWFLPRYRGGALHEAALTMHLVRLCGPDACFIDVGANLGWFACGVGRHLDGGEVHSFEMDDLSYALLRRNVALIGLDHVRCTLAAVGDREGHATYFRPPGVASPGASVVQKREAFSERVERDMITLDGYCAEHGVAPDVIKIDVEGAEMAVLQGMRDVLRRHRPVLQAGNLCFGGRGLAACGRLHRPGRRRPSAG